MAVKNVVDIALADIDSKIADLQRAKDIIVRSASTMPAEADAPKKRGRKPKRGLPTQPVDQSTGD